jgi:hypothetical protein
MSAVAPYPVGKANRDPVSEIERLAFLASGYWTPEARRAFHLAVMDRASAALKIAEEWPENPNHHEASLWLWQDHPNRLNLILATLGRGPV